MLKLLSVFLMCVGSMCLGARAQGVSKGGLTREYGVKLCGREFIRAVIFTCGGSRWKRLSEDSDSPLGIEKNLPLGSAFHTAPEGEDSLSRLQSILERPPLPITQLSLKDLVSLYGVYSDYESVPDDLGELLQQVSELRQQQKLQTTEKVGNSPHIPWLKSPRRKRNFSVGLAGMCCNQGCTKNDIGRLC
ncbi:prorelaxin H1 [Lepisosteus oculatus]|uniref:Relaxin-3-like n=1 Tax=Lepisosteus oculatus TaxID=7918 RepID=W5MVI7_LEPOC|nr:PREDICTED: relaxin-3-like [Lepisosteus oculatus]